MKRLTLTLELLCISLGVRNLIQHLRQGDNEGKRVLPSSSQTQKVATLSVYGFSVNEHRLVLRLGTRIYNLLEASQVPHGYECLTSSWAAQTFTRIPAIAAQKGSISSSSMNGIGYDLQVFYVEEHD